MLVPIATEITPFPSCFSSFFLVKGYKLKELRAVFLLLLYVHYCYPSDPCTSMVLLFPVFFSCYLLVLSFKGKHNFLYQSCRSLRLWYQVLILPSQALSLAPKALPNLPFIMCYPRNSLLYHELYSHSFCFGQSIHISILNICFGQLPGIVKGHLEFFPAII